ncbi:unnamed protein product [Arctogadus glacialis]
MHSYTEENTTGWTYAARGQDPRICHQSLGYNSGVVLALVTLPNAAAGARESPVCHVSLHCCCGPFKRPKPHASNSLFLSLWESVVVICLRALGLLPLPQLCSPPVTSIRLPW